MMLMLLLLMLLRLVLLVVRYIALCVAVVLGAMLVLVPSVLVVARQCRVGSLVYARAGVAVLHALNHLELAAKRHQLLPSFRVSFHDANDL